MKNSVPPPFALRLTAFSRPWYTRAYAAWVRTFR